MAHSLKDLKESLDRFAFSLDPETIMKEMQSFTIALLRHFINASVHYH